VKIQATNEWARQFVSFPDLSRTWFITAIVLNLSLKPKGQTAMPSPRSIKSRPQKAQNRGLITYAKVKHAQPLLHSVNSLEGILSLIGIVTLILFLLTGSFQSAGQALDQFFQIVISPLKSMITKFI